MILLISYGVLEDLLKFLRKMLCYPEVLSTLMADHAYWGASASASASASEKVITSLPIWVKFKQHT